MAYIGQKPADKPLGASDITDGIISNSKLAQDIISAETELATAPADTDEFLISDAGTLKRIDASLVGGGGITEADQFRLTASVTGNGIITSNLERPDSSGFAKIGTGMTESSGVFSFPSTGIYQILVQADYYYNNQADNSAQLATMVTLNNSSYTGVAWAMSGNGNQSGAMSQTTYSQYFLDVTDVSQVKVYFERFSMGGMIEGDTDVNRTSFSFIRLGDT